MANLLKEMEIEEVSLVGEGANPHAKILLSKAKRDAPLRTENGVQYPIQDYAYAPDPKHPDTWKLRLTKEPGGAPDARIVGAVLAALGPTGFRGNQVKIPSNDLPAVKAKVATAWQQIHPDKDELPLVLRKSGEVTMTEEEIRAMLEDNNKLLMEMISAKMDGMGKAEDDAPSEDDMEDAQEDAAEEDMEKAEEDMEKAEDDMEKASDDEEDEKDMSKELAKKFDAQSATIKKQATELAKTNAALAEMKKSSELAAFTAQAGAELSHLPGTVADKGEILYKMAKAMPDQFEKAMELLKAGSVAMESVTKSQAGSSTSTTTSAYDALIAKAKEYAEKDGTTEAVAFNKVRKIHPDMWNKHRQEKRSES